MNNESPFALAKQLSVDNESPFALAKQLSVVSMTEKLVKYKLIEVAQAFCYSSI